VQPLRNPGRFCRLGLAGALLVLLAACGRNPQSLQLDGPTMGTTYSLSIARLPPGVGRAQVEAVLADVLRDSDQCLSGWNPASELSRFNASSSTDWQPVSPALAETVAQALAVSAASGGAFDITVRPLVAAWGFGAGAADGSAPPSDEVIAQLLGQVGYARLERRESPAALRKLVPTLSLDLDGIAPGWAVDRLAARLDALGIQDYLVELGGEVLARGRNAEGRRWRVAVETPLAGVRRAQAVIELDATGVSTSGDYRDYREVDGRRVSHTIDPRTGRPVAHGLASVTVVHPSVAAADAWATALTVLGPEEGMALARREGLAALFIVRGDGPGGFVESETPEFGRLRLPQAARL
jgi:thiamine biosynthesis lipoprotein